MLPVLLSLGILYLLALGAFAANASHVQKRWLGPAMLAQAVHQVKDAFGAALPGGTLPHNGRTGYRSLRRLMREPVRLRSFQHHH